MENATQALKMAFAVMFFVMALSLTITVFAKARQTSEIVLQSSDDTLYYEYDSIIGTEFESRIVGLETIIPTVYKYSKENYKVTFKECDISEDNIKNEFTKENFKLKEWVSSLRNLYIYKTPSNPDLWNKNYKDENGNRNTETSIYSFDIGEETQRNEPWTASDLEVKKNLDAIFSGSKYLKPSDGSEYIDYSSTVNNPFLNKNRKYIELIGRQVTSPVVNTNATTNETTKSKIKTIITYVRLDTN